MATLQHQTVHYGGEHSFELVISGEFASEARVQEVLALFEKAQKIVREDYRSSSALLGSIRFVASDRAKNARWFAPKHCSRALSDAGRIVDRTSHVRQ